MKLRAWAGPAAVLTALTLSGCGALTPGTASVVGDEKISMSQVDDLAAAQCTALDAAGKSGQSQALPVSDIKRRSLGLLMDTALSKQYADSQDAAANPQVTQLIYGQIEQSISALPAKARGPLGDAFEKWAEARSALVTVAARESGETPSTSNLEKLLDAGVAARQKWQKSITIDTDPRFSPDKTGFPGPGDGSVSQASSSFAKGGVASQVDPSWVDQLPASQKCG